MYVCMYVYVCIHISVCMYVCMYVRISATMHNELQHLTLGLAVVPVITDVEVGHSVLKLCFK